MSTIEIGTHRTSTANVKWIVKNLTTILQSVCEMIQPTTPQIGATAIPITSRTGAGCQTWKWMPVGLPAVAAAVAAAAPPPVA